MNILNGAMLAVTLASIGACIFLLLTLRNTIAENASLRDQAEKQSKWQKARDKGPVLVEMAVPLECIGTVRCDFDDICYAQVLGKEFETDEATYQRVVEARITHLRRKETV